MKRIHLHMGVKDLDKNISFYEALFKSKPTKMKSDYAQWILEDPKINFAISTRVKNQGVDHLGIQVDSIDELNIVRSDLNKANVSTHSEGEVTCCYAKSEKSWVTDPNGMAWETYHSMENAETYHGIDKPEKKSNCC